MLSHPIKVLLKVFSILFKILSAYCDVYVLCRLVSHLKDSNEFIKKYLKISFGGKFKFDIFTTKVTYLEVFASRSNGISILNHLPNVQ